MRQSTFSTTKFVLLTSAFLAVFVANSGTAFAQDKAGSNEKIMELKKKRLALLVSIAEGSAKLEPKTPMLAVSIWAEVFAARLDLTEKQEERIFICEQRIQDLKKSDVWLVKKYEAGDLESRITRIDLDRMQVYILEAQIALEKAKAGK